MRKFKVFDLFAGAGGFGLGFELAGYNIELAIEKDRWAYDTLVANSDESKLILNSDIRDLRNLSIIKTVTTIRPDVIIGGPPCQGFSLAGPQKDPNDPRNSLFKEFANWVGMFQPQIIVMENVTGLLHRKNSQGDLVTGIIKRTFEDMGYTTNLWILNAADYGVPQNRVRIFFVGDRNGVVIPPPRETHYKDLEKKKAGMRKAVTVGQAISDLPVIYAGGGSEIMEYTKKPTNNYQRILRVNSADVHNHVAMKHTKRMIARYTEIINGASLDEIDDTLKVRKRNGNGELSEVRYVSNYRHLKPDQISFTIPASFYSNFIHPFYPRNITSREAARIQSFPDWYVFKGKRTQMSSSLLATLGRNGEDFLSQYNQIGNAVPPLLANQIAEHLKDYF